MKKLRIEVGPGDMPRKDYIHCDIRKLPHVEHVCNAWEIPYKENSVDEIYSRHMLEHLTFQDTCRTLEHWYKILKRGGSIDVNVPDLEIAIKQFFWKGKSKFVPYNVSNRQHALYSIYGWQTNPEDIHKWGYTFQSLKELLEKIGFENIGRIPDDESLSGELNLRVKAFKGPVSKILKKKTNLLTSIFNRLVHYWNKLVIRIARTVLIKI